MSTSLDVAERRRRELASTVKRLRVAAMSDPERTEELADALVQLTANRLRAWSFAEAATDAPESVVLAARILAQRGPAGPYASLADAVRYFTASAQLAAVQAGLGEPEAAGRTLAALDGWRGQLGRLPLLENLPPATVVWALLARGRSLLSTDVSRANAFADAAGLHLYGAGLDEDADAAYLAVAVHLVLADCRWAAGRTEAALAHHRLALARHHAAVQGLETGKRPRPGLALAAMSPLPELIEPYALRLEASGEVAAALAVRRSGLATLARFADPVTDAEALAAAAAALGRALIRAGRDDEAAAESARSPAPVPDALAEETQPPTPREWVEWTQLASAEALRVGEPGPSAFTRLQRAEQAAVFEGAAARAEAERSEARIRAEAERAAAEQAAEAAEAERLVAERAAAERAAAAERERRDAEAARARRAAEEAAARVAAEERRRELAEAHEQAHWADPQVARMAEAELADAKEQVASAGSDLVAQAVAQERLAELLRPLALTDPATHGNELVSTLEALVGLRWRLGDPDGSREAAREAKALAAGFGR